MSGVIDHVGIRVSDLAVALAVHLEVVVGAVAD